MIKIMDAIFNLLADRAGDIRVEDVRIGLGYTAVLLDNAGAGLAYTMRKDLPEGCSVFHGLRPLAGRKAASLLPLLKSDLSIDAAVGLATANALSNHEKRGMIKGDVVARIEIRPSDRAGMVGLFAPLVNPLQEKAASLKIFERNPRREGFGILPLESMEEVLPSCQVVIISSTALINGTIDEVLALTKGCREVVMLGPSTPLMPEAFKDTPVTWLSGVVVKNPEAILRIVSEGGGMRYFRDTIVKVNMRVGLTG